MKNEQITYPPLKAAKSFEAIHDYFRANNIDAEELIKYTIEDGILPDSCKPLLANAMLANIRGEMNADGQEVTKFLLKAALTGKWLEEKQVFKFDDTFFQRLFNTERICITKDMWDYLPFKTFYVDLSACNVPLSQVGKRIDGFFVNIEKTKNNDYVITSLCSVNNAAGITTNESSYVIKNSESVSYPISSYKDENHKNLLILFTQILNYLSIEKPDIRESEETKRSYKPRPEGSKPKITTKDMRKWEVGYRYGAEFRKSEKERQEQSETSGHTGAAKSPHFRRAHWHTYNYGSKANPQKRLKWLDVIAVNMGDFGKDDKDKLPAVIRKTHPEEKPKKKKDSYERD